MGRQRFLHHYLPAHIASTLVAGAVIEFVFNIDPIVPNDNNGDLTAAETAVTDRKYRIPKGRLGQQSLLALWAAVGVILSATMYGFYFFAPLTYGRPGLDVAGVLARRWLSYELHFAK